ncbi:tetratricopeptide repeat-containing sensor histidine kinase [Pedobacter sp.]|uniref:tetratricopeptide repeat-containing sensor histidine kinase n=1 Tax=Pedobacter sp. TaxID=1411316 RepID=UPI003BAB8A08
MKKIILLIAPILLIFSCTKQQKKVAYQKDADYKKAESFFNANNDSAFYYFNKTAANSKDNLQIALAYNYMAIIQSQAGDYFGSNESALTALKYLSEKSPTHFDQISSCYNELTLNTITLENFDEAVNYSNLALKYATDTPSKLVILNNKALALREQKKYNEAIKIYKQILPQHKSTNTEYARALTNLTYAKWLNDKTYNPIPEFLTALKIRQSEKDKWGLNASYAHLADYYETVETKLALDYAKKMYEVAKELSSPDDLMTALQKLIKFSPATEAKSYFEVYHKLNDSLQTARNAAKNQFALIRFETEKHKADNLKLQKENTDKKYQIIKRDIIIFSVLVSVIVAIFFVYNLSKKRKQRLDAEVKKTIQDNLLKTSKKVHDVVANGLYRVMTEIENKEEIEREEILDRLDYMYQKSRDISYEVEEPENTEPNFHIQVEALLQSFNTASTKINTHGNTESLWFETSDVTRKEIEHILQELMVNMKKHSSATNVIITFEHHQNHIQITYTDDGIGIKEPVKYNNGLTNTGNRIEYINGKITFDTKVEKGLKIVISFPVS